MHLCTVRNTELRVNLLVLPVAAGAFVLGRGNDFLLALVALLLHEVSHALMAAAFGCRIETLELLPFGGVARIRHSSLSPYAEFCIAAAGPVTSFVLGGFTAAAMFFLPRSAFLLDAFLGFNLTLAAVNLLPALPLDGGRMLRCLLESRLGTGRATRLACALGLIFGLGLTAVCFFAARRGSMNPTLLVMGVFLALTALLEWLRAPEKQLSAFLKINGSLRAGAGVSVHTIAANGSMTAGEAMRILRANRFNVLRVVDGNMHTIGELDEVRLIAGIARFGAGAPIRQLLFDRKAEM